MPSLRPHYTPYRNARPDLQNVGPESRFQIFLENLCIGCQASWNYSQLQALLHSREQSCMRGPSPLLLRWLSASPAAGNEAWTQGLLKCQQHQNHLTRGKPDCQAPPRVSVVSEIWAPENMHLLRVLNDMTMVLDHSPHFRDHSFEDSILPLSPNS